MSVSRGEKQKLSAHPNTIHHASPLDKLIHLQNELTTAFENMVTEAIAPGSRRESISLATAQTPEEFSICVINVEQKLHTGGR